MSENLLELLDPPFPLVYQKLLGNETHFQMTKSRLSRECAICERQFSIFFWRRNGIPFKTSICQICAKIANVCQVSLLDLDTGIPIIVRNKLLQAQKEDYQSSTRRWYNNRLLDRKIIEGENWIEDSIPEQMRQIDPAIIARIQQLVEKDPYLSFQKPAICQGFLENNCIYGDACYYAHELPAPGEHCPNSTKFGIRGRYFGTSDPNGQAIIEKMLSIDPSVFQGRKEEEPQEEKMDEEQLPTEVEEEIVFEVPKCYTQIYDEEHPIPFENMDTCSNNFPKFIDGVLKMV